MNFNMTLTQEQKLVMTQQMQLSVKLLQMSSNELLEYINKEYAENPVIDANYEKDLEEVKMQDKYDYKEMIKYFEFDNYGNQSFGSYDQDEVSPFTFISTEKTLKDFLLEQIMELSIDEFQRTICKYIIESLDARGYLDISLEDILEELNISQEVGEEALELVQSLEPTGIGARNLIECLEIQLTKRGYGNEKLYTIVEDHLEDIAENRYAQIAKALNITPKEAQEYGDIIKTLEPKPSRGFYTGEEVKFIIPDATIRKIDGEYFIIMNEGVLPKLSINPMYKEILNESKDNLAKDYVKQKISGAMFLIKSIEQRKSTLYRVLEKILEKQKEYFEKGENYLKPMTLKEISEALDVHESTVSRAIRDKFILIDRGTIKIKDLFTTGIAGDNGEEDINTIKVKNEIKKLVDSESKEKPLSDQIICNELNNNGFNISRRTVAKYREEMGIKSSSKRKRF
ncbi:RNA polymerase factor sigma-54 [Clostridium sp. 'White wine YQ']|uniref:RNA polymerase factor sigma-54 n=1 Tax=Clostridium sp. 'White wine YQ' TaxID=3027474 RepID=UPI0023657E60|nr:RNA polymerase factor sigma-54 [Clostridium sp. 'White wine YQ']MDD7792823.1 RNA polymerase factor sigma-54 [Clostridium sp. 'White wine YQ']